MPDVVLRPYQISAVNELRKAVQKFSSCVYVLPTGGGKMIVAASIAKGAFARGKRTVMLVHRRELVKQAVETLEEALPSVSVGVEAPGWPSQPWAALQVAMVQSIHRRKKLSIDPGLILIDEAHHARAATWEKVLARWPDVPRIGFTATPERLDGKGLDEHFESMVMGPTIPELVEQNALAPTIVRRIPQAVFQDTEDSSVASAVHAYVDYALGKKAIFFGEDIAHSQSVCIALRERGVRAEHVDGTDSAARRDRVMMEFKTGGLDVVGNCDIISEGFDAPSCEVVIMGARTTSITRYLQQAGRVMRYQAGKVAEVLDLVGNSFGLGLPDDARNWTLTGGLDDSFDSGQADPRACPECKMLFRGNSCPQCGYQIIGLEQEREADKRVELEIAQPGAAKVQRKRKGPRMPRTELNKLLYGARRSPDTMAELRAIAERNGYKEGWVKHVARAMGVRDVEQGAGV